MTFEKAVIDAIDLGYEVTLMRAKISDAVKVDLVWRGMDEWASVSELISRLVIEESRSGNALADLTKKLTNNLRESGITPRSTKDG